MSPFGDSQVTSMTLLALVSRFWSGSTTTQSSLHQPGSVASSSQSSAVGAPSTSTVRSAGLDLVELPRDRAALLLRLAVLDAVEGVGAPLRLDELVRRPALEGDGLVPHQAREDRARLVAAGRLDVEPLEEVGVTGVGLDLRLGGGAGEGQRALGDALGAGHLDHLADPAEPGQVAWAEVEHADAVAEDTVLLVDDDVGRLDTLLHRSSPPASARCLRRPARCRAVARTRRDVRRRRPSRRQWCRS